MNTYPIFLNLEKRKVLIVGGGKIAERKVKSLLANKPQIQIVAKNLTAKLQQLCRQGKVSFLSGEFQTKYLEQVFLVIIATNDQQLNKTIFEAAEANGILCNSVDNSQYCSFITPTVIDRNPVKIAISSGGNAPVLIRLLKQKIETILPNNLGKMASVAGKWRQWVKECIPTFKQRRYFWESLFQSKFLHYISTCDDSTAAEIYLQKHIQDYEKDQGEVVLVGAGPGDPGLLTLHALQAMHRADIVFYDALVSRDILQLIRLDAQKICVGKRAGKTSISQQQINDLLIKAAKQGQRVVRLKGGDPMVFARGGEELEALSNADIPYRVIPGITAALGATAYSGIPLTHRDYAHSVLFVTGHIQSETFDWSGVVKNKPTLLIYMGVLKIEEITARLIEYGRDKKTPVAIISNATRIQQKIVISQLSLLPQLAESAEKPALIVIGEVVLLQEKLAWFGQFSTKIDEKLFVAA